MQDRIRIVLVDDHPLFRSGVANTLKGDENLEVVAEGASAADAYHLAFDFLPDIMLLDISMPGGGVNAAQTLATTFPVIKTVMLTVSEDDDDVVNSLKAGAQGYILKGIGGPELIEIVKNISSGDSYVSPGLAARLLGQGHQDQESDTQNMFADLTHREDQILQCVAKGWSNREIGQELSITEKTVKHYMTNILQKLQVRNRVEAALLAHQHHSKSP